MASTYVDNYTLVDTISAQAVSSTQYNSNEGAAVLTTDSYAPTSSSVHTIPTALRSLATGALTDDGYSQKSLYELLLMISVNWDNAMKSLDDSGGVAKTDYEALAAIGPLDGDYTSAFATSSTGLALGLGQEAAVGLERQGIKDSKLAVFCQALATQIAACTANLDADATLNDTDYASTLDIDFSAKTGWVPPLTTSTAFDITSPASKIQTKGIDHGALIDFLNTVVTNINALWVKLDADI